MTLRPSIFSGSLQCSPRSSVWKVVSTPSSAPNIVTSANRGPRTSEGKISVTWKRGKFDGHLGAHSPHNDARIRHKLKLLDSPCICALWVGWALHPGPVDYRQIAQLWSRPFAPCSAPIQNLGTTREWAISTAPLPYGWALEWREVASNTGKAVQDTASSILRTCPSNPLKQANTALALTIAETASRTCPAAFPGARRACAAEAGHFCP